MASLTRVTDAAMEPVSLAEMKDTLAIVEKFQDKALDILTSRSHMSRRVLQNKWKKTDWYMDADEALKHGFIDRIEA